jgi:hypothetical protein
MVSQAFFDSSWNHISGSESRIRYILDLLDPEPLLFERNWILPSTHKYVQRTIKCLKITFELFFFLMKSLLLIVKYRSTFIVTLDNFYL